MTTYQTYQTDDDQLAPAHDQAIPQDSPAEPEATLATPEPEATLATAEPDLTEPAEPEADPTAPEADLAEPEASLATAEPDLTEPDTDLATAEPDLTEPAEPDADPMVPEADTADMADQAEPDADLAYLADLATAEPDLADPDADLMVPEADLAELAGPEMADSSPGSPSLVSGAFTVPESDTDARPAADTASAAGPWHQIQAMFVDDPRASIQRAAGLVDDRAGQLIQSVRERQRSIQSAWQADDAGTEELRVALQHYRSFWTSLDELPAQT
jgi:hypothetical protein